MTEPTPSQSLSPPASIPSYPLQEDRGLGSVPKSGVVEEVESSKSVDLNGVPKRTLNWSEVAAIVAGLPGGASQPQTSLSSTSSEAHLPTPNGSASTQTAPLSPLSGSMSPPRSVGIHSWLLRTVSCADDSRLPLLLALYIFNIGTDLVSS